MLLKKGGRNAEMISWIREKTSFALLRSRPSALEKFYKTITRVPCDARKADSDVEIVEGAID